MPGKVLVAYATNSGSTLQVAEAVVAELEKASAQVEVRRVEEVADLGGYTAVVVGGPMIMGWHREARKFLKKHRKALSQVPVAYFFTAMSLTKTGETGLDGVPLFIDPQLAKDPKNPPRLSYREGYATVMHYLGDVLRAVPQVKPVSAAFFGGKLDYFNLKVLQRLFVMLSVQAQPGDRRNWVAIRDWAANLPALFGIQVQ